MKVACGCNPNATPLKREVMAELESMGHEVADFGSDDPIYANVVIDVAEAVVQMMARTYFENTGNFDPAGRSGPKVQRIYDYAAEHDADA